MVSIDVSQNQGIEFKEWLQIFLSSIKNNYAKFEELKKKFRLIHCFKIEDGKPGGYVIDIRELRNFYSSMSSKDICIHSPSEESTTDTR